MKHQSYLARFVKSDRSGLILTALVIEMLVSPAADYHPHFGAAGPSLFASGALGRAGALVLDPMGHLRGRASRSTKPGDGARRIVYRLAGDFHRLRPTLPGSEPSSYPAVQPGHPHGQDISILLYFRMVTISSVGYGFIAAVNPDVRMVAAFESVTGLLYIAVGVARLVSSYRESEERAPE